MIARMLTPVRVFGFAVVVALVWGYNAHLERYITPTRGLGYALGIVGGSLMLVLLMYPARKRAQWLHFIGGVPIWYRIHMTLGIVGPLLVLFHSNFSLGATNSNVALFCMLAVSGSGLIGRYIYSRVYGDWHEHKATLEELQAAAELLRKQSNTITLLPGYLGAIEHEEQRLLCPARTPVGALVQPATMAMRSVLARWRLHNQIRDMVIEAARQSPMLAVHGRRLTASATSYATRRLDAVRRVREHGYYVKLFSLWHVAHVPFFIMTLVAGIVHVISVTVY
jgi:hypothetical protein